VHDCAKKINGVAIQWIMHKVLAMIPVVSAFNVFAFIE